MAPQIAELRAQLRSAADWQPRAERAEAATNEATLQIKILESEVVRTTDVAARLPELETRVAQRAAKDAAELERQRARSRAATADRDASFEALIEVKHLLEGVLGLPPEDGDAQFSGITAVGGDGPGPKPASRR